ncbi:hypothetical protein BDY21DRAFT_284939 [Lineolata rhizophorae]|uniref:Uncharacterized protein n=1 Tax=Lineolata rhizophorae TaxID=578093 RepID=A0A6A6P1V7_9PEZI|nr:hypothetical protein BDY21DRAFT_284939 [Lineolata rhizophorae]
MLSAADLQALLRFLSQDAKIPLASAMGKVKELEKAELTSPQTISKTPLTKLQTIFTDEKAAKQILNAAKRVTKKRAGGPSSDSPSSSPRASKKPKPTSPHDTLDPRAYESSLALPTSNLSLPDLSAITIHTNRAPLLLAFALTTLAYTMPSQPLSSRLSLAQGVVSANSKTKAISIGLDKGPAAEREGWGEGQPVVRVLGRDIRVMRREGHAWEAAGGATDGGERAAGQGTQAASQALGAGEPQRRGDAGDDAALWAVDLEALKRARAAPAPEARAARAPSAAPLPIYTPESARTYLLKAFDSSAAAGAPSGASPASAAAAAAAAATAAAAAKRRREENLAHLLAALDALCASWASTLGTADLDARAWAWYVRVRPEVEAGPAGWGGKGDVRLADVLGLRREEGERGARGT